MANKEKKEKITTHYLTTERYPWLIFCFISFPTLLSTHVQFLFKMEFHHIDYLCSIYCFMHYNISILIDLVSAIV